MAAPQPRPGSAAAAVAPAAPGSAAADPVAAVRAAFPGREQQVRALAEELTNPSANGMLAYGPPSTGKTAITRCRACLLAACSRLHVPSSAAASCRGRLPAPLLTRLPRSRPPLPRALLRALNVRHAFIGCHEMQKPRLLLSSVLHQVRLPLPPSLPACQPARFACIRAEMGGRRLAAASRPAAAPRAAPPCVPQLKGGKRLREEGFECGGKCDTVAEFRLQLPGAPAVGLGRGSVGRQVGGRWQRSMP